MMGKPLQSIYITYFVTFLDVLADDVVNKSADIFLRVLLSRYQFRETTLTEILFVCLGQLVVSRVYSTSLIEHQSLKENGNNSIL